MNYPEGIRKKYNECMYEERDMFAMNNAHEIMQGMGDDWDLETILSFVRYKE